MDPRSREASVVEAHIERGVAVASLPAYLRDAKLRVMVLRLRADLPVMVGDPMLPHEAAAFAYRQAGARHIPYDFAMDAADHSRWFCSEVASAAYARLGVTLWMGLSHISSPGLASWLAAFGVRHLTTQEPADLEYDPTDIAQLLEPLRSGEARVVFGTRAFKSHSAFSFWYVVGNRAVTFVAHLLYNSWISDLMTGYKAMETELFRSLDLRERGFAIEAEITARAEEADVIAAAASDEMQAAVDFGLASPFPAAEEAVKYVYA